MSDISEGLSSSSLSKRARESTLRMTHAASASHVASSLSCIDILSVIYLEQIVKSGFDKSNLDRNVFIQSKGHAASALYAVLAHLNRIPIDDLNDFCKDGSKLGGHVSAESSESVELSTGSLGHGIPFGLGVALGKKLSGHHGRVFVLASDGECNEGTTWESALIANQFNLSNLTVILDRNGFQSLGPTEEIMMLEPLAEKWRAFGWNVQEIDGHNHEEIKHSLRVNDRPNCVIAKTIKGKGVSFMENTNLWHYKSPNTSELREALIELGIV
jgi:transketolase